MALRILIVATGLVIETVTTTCATPSQYGRLSTVLEGLKNIGKSAGVVLLGFGIDYFGTTTVFLTLGTMAVIFAVTLHSRQDSEASRQLLADGVSTDARNA